MPRIKRILQFYKRFITLHPKVYVGIVFILVFMVAIMQGIAHTNKEIELQTIPTDGRKAIPFMIPYRGELVIEIDYFENLSINKELCNFLIWTMFNDSNILINQITWTPINISSITFSYADSSEFANLMNDTKDYPNAVHLVILENFIVNNIINCWGYTPSQSSWRDMIENYSDPRYSGSIVAYNQIVKDLGDDLWLSKIICHEIGRAINCQTDVNGIMRIGIKLPPYSIMYYLELSFGLDLNSIMRISQWFFSFQSQLQMDLQNIWSVQKGFYIYK